MDKQKLDNQLEPIYSSSVPIRDVVWKTCREWWTTEMSVERGSGKSMLATNMMMMKSEKLWQLRDLDFYVICPATGSWIIQTFNQLKFLSVCVCVCVCVYIYIYIYIYMYIYIYIYIKFMVRKNSNWRISRIPLLAFIIEEVKGFSCLSRFSYIYIYIKENLNKQESDLQWFQAIYIYIYIYIGIIDWYFCLSLG